MTPEQIFNIDLYLTENGEKGKLNRILAEVCEIFDSRCDTPCRASDHPHTYTFAVESTLAERGRRAFLNRPQSASR